MWYANSISVELPQASVARSFAVPEPGVSKSIASSAVTLTSDWSVRAERKDAASMTSPTTSSVSLAVASGGRVSEIVIRKSDRTPSFSAWEM